MSHLHNIIDSDVRYRIDPVTRTITSESGKTKLVQYDHNSERFAFEIPRYIENHDMALCDKVEIHYINVSGNSQDKSADVYLVDDVQISPADQSVAIFSWLISANATKYAGTLNFLIRFVCLDGETIEYAWNTEIFSRIAIASGMDNGESVIAENSDVLEAWKNEIFADIENAVNRAEAAATIAEGATTKAVEATAAAEEAMAKAESVLSGAEEIISAADTAKTSATSAQTSRQEAASAASAASAAAIAANTSKTDAQESEEAAQKAAEMAEAAAGRVADLYINPMMFGAVGDGKADDTAAMQTALNYAADNNATLFLPNGKKYRITSSLVLKAKKYTIKGEGVKWYHFIPELPEYGALFVGEHYPTDWTEIELHMDGVNAQPNDDKTTKGCTFMRGLDCRYSSRIAHCKINHFGIVFEGTVTVVSTIADCQFHSFREYFMCGVYRDANGEFVMTKERGLLNDSKIINCYISGSKNFFPVVFGTGRFDNDAQINNCFIEFCEYVFTRKVGSAVGVTVDIQGCTLNRCIIQNCANMFERLMVTEFRFYACEFVGFSAADSLSNYYGQCADLEARISGRKCGVYIKEAEELSYRPQMYFENCFVQNCDYFIWLKASATSVYTRNEAWHVYERGTTYDNTNSSFIEDPVYIEYYADDEGFKSCWFDTLNNISFDALPSIDVQGAIKKNVFNGQIIHTPNGIYMATRAYGSPSYVQMDFVAEEDTTEYLCVKLANNKIVPTTPPSDLPMGISVNAILPRSGSDDGFDTIPNPNSASLAFLTSYRIASAASNARQELRVPGDPNLYVRNANGSSAWKAWYCLTATEVTT